MFVLLLQKGNERFSCDRSQKASGHRKLVMHIVIDDTTGPMKCGTSTYVDNPGI